MKKFIIACTVIVMFAAGWLFLSSRIGMTFQWESLRKTSVETFTKVEGKTILVDQGQGLAPFEIRGVNLGSGIPGHFATDYAIDKETYLRWFEEIQAMGANCIRVYTLLQDDFYNAFWEYNKDREQPLYLIHGLWVNDYTLFSHRDAYDPDFMNTMIQDSRTLVDIIHGNKRFSLGEGLGSGSYNHDISQWVLGYILGVEWEDTTVAFTDHMQNKKNQYHGKYMTTTDDATPFEAMLAQVGDKIIEYETQTYKAQRLIAFANWPTTDPLEWDSLVEYYFRKFEQVDVEHIQTTDRFLSGQFASYHVYPYYPDYYGFMDVMDIEVENKQEFVGADGVFNSYRAYLTTLNDYHTMPVVIAEFGVPSSRGRAQSDRNTQRAQGGMSEADQAEALKTCYQDIMSADCAGSIVFTWQDEWFKRTWNTMAYTDLTKTPYWSDVQTNEQFFGVLAFDPGDEKSVCYVDGDVSEWTADDQIQLTDTPYGQLSLAYKYDEKYLYLYVNKENYNPQTDKLWIPLDTTPKTGSRRCDGIARSFERPADFVLILDGTENSKLVVQKRYEALRAIYSHRVYFEDAYLNVPPKDTSEFVDINLVLQIPDDPHDELANVKIDVAETYPTGLLRHGNANPESPDFDSLADFMIQGDTIEIRLPWSLLNFLNPSEMMIHDDYYEHYGIEGLKISEIYAGVGLSADGATPIPMTDLPLKGWGRYPTSHERLKQGYFAMQDIWAGK